MGIFSSKYKTTVGTSISRVIEDENIPNSIITGMTKSIMNSDGQMIENCLEELTQSVGVRVNNMYQFGKTKYINGLPNGTRMHSKSGEAVVLQALKEVFGNDITIDYYHFGPLNNLHYGWYTLQEQYSYKSDTNQLITSRPVYLNDLVVVVSEATVDELANGSLATWGPSPRNGQTESRPFTKDLAAFTPFEVDPSSESDYLKVSYNFKNADHYVQSGEFRLNVTGVDTSADFHHVRYIKNGVAKYWLYRHDSGTYPAIDSLYTANATNAGSYIPWGYFRYGKKSLVDNKTTQEYKDNKKLMDFLGLDYDTVGKAINENPDIDDVEQAILMAAVPANSTDPMDVRYLFDFFSNVYAQHVSESTEVILGKALQDIVNKIKGNAPNSLGVNSIVIQDKKFKLTLNYRSITKTRGVGYLNNNKKYQGGFAKFTETTYGTKHGIPYNQSSEVTNHFYRKQVGVGLYEEIRIEGLEMRYHIFEDYYETADENENILLIPVDMSIIDSYSINDRELLVCRSLHYIFNSRVVTKIKWYQRGVFKVIMFVVAVVIAVYSGGSGAGLLAAIASGSSALVVAALIQIAINLLIQYAISLALRLFVKLVGGKFALIVALVAVIYGGYQAIQAGSIKGAPFASELLSLSSGLSDAVSIELKSDMRDLANEYSEFADMVSSETEKLERKKDELLYNNYLTPEIIFGEKPEEFYDRTVHSGNIGVLSIEAIGAYYDIALSLPQFNETIGA